ncbi:MAG TPA: hypothetical protein VGQ47_01530 [Candidatus Limnocylindrales bacterium]|nr:hypothetical protein [Candidatus Limnocylindrales bacterium]
MADAMSMTQSAVRELGDLEEDDLYRLLGMRLKAIERDPAKAGQFAPDVGSAQELGITAADLRDFGRRAFVHVARVGHMAICGQNAEGFHLERILSALNTDAATATAVVATVLVAQLAIAPAIAGIVATIVIGRVAPSSLEALCQVWSRKLEPAAVEQPEIAPPPAQAAASG